MFPQVCPFSAYEPSKTTVTLDGAFDGFVPFVLFWERSVANWKKREHPDTAETVARCLVLTIPDKLARWK